MYLSIIDSLGANDHISFAFIDIGCRPASLDWLQQRNISVHSLTDTAVGALADPRYGYHRAQTCRPFLPKLFPDAQILTWVDCDTWFQDVSIFEILRKDAMEYRDHILVSPEIHYTYSKINTDVARRRREMFGYYSGIYGEDAAGKLCLAPTVNSGFFAMHRSNPLWAHWEIEVKDIYQYNYDKYGYLLRHFGEQISLNKLILDGAPARYFDPLYNYLCLWTPPTRGSDGTVRLSAPPYSAIGMLHLAGGWKHFGHEYMARNLLYRSGDYLTPIEKADLVGLLDPEWVTEGYR
jgi:hypothetical protein